MKSPNHEATLTQAKLVAHIKITNTAAEPPTDRSNGGES